MSKGVDKLCVPPRRWFAALVEGEPLPWWRALYVRCHYYVCPMCQAYKRSLDATTDALRSLRDPE